MAAIELTMDEVLYLEALLREAMGTGRPIGLVEGGENLAQSVLDKLEKV